MAWAGIEGTVLTDLMDTAIHVPLHSRLRLSESGVTELNCTLELASQHNEGKKERR